jgi:hypothetical protein
MAGESLPTLHTQNVQQAWHVDPAGNDTTGDGTTSNPWRTVQKAADHLKTAATWPTTGDVAVYLHPGTYKAPSTAAYTLDLSFAAGARSPNSTRWLIFKPAPGTTGTVKIANPDGLTGSKGCVRVAATNGNNYICFDGIDIDGEQTVKGAAGNGNSVGVYLVGLPVAHIELVRCHIHGFRGASGAGNTQALQSGSSTDVKIYHNHIHDIDAPASGTNENESHGVYLPGANVYVVGNLIEDIPNGYNVHFYGTPAAGNGAIVANNTLADANASGIVIPGDAVGATIKNNLLVDHTGRGSDSFGIQFFPASSGAGTGNVIDRNLAFNNTGGARSETAPVGWTITNSIAADPLFVGAGDYHLQSGSPAINAGDTAYQPAFDVDGDARGAADLGAYAFTVVPDPDPGPDPDPDPIPGPTTGGSTVGHSGGRRRIAHSMVGTLEETMEGAVT